MRPCKLLLTLLILAASGLVASAQEANPKKPLMDENEPNISKFMRAKLTHSQKLLESLALEDYETMAKSSQEMSLLTLAESWQVLQTPDYLHESMAFRRSADAVTAAAKKKNLDGAALAYVEMTMQCVKCHKMVRHSKMASLDSSDFKTLATRDRAGLQGATRILPIGTNAK
jgi:cytochrome c556